MLLHEVWCRIGASHSSTSLTITSSNIIKRHPTHSCHTPTPPPPVVVMSLLTELPDRLEVVLRISLSLILASVLTLGSFPSVVPSSQLVLIASVTSAFTMVMPTLLFSIGAAVFPGMIMSACVGLLNSTLLLAVAARGGVHAYMVCYFFDALLLAGLRFTDQGAMTALLIMLTSLNTMSLASVAEEKGLGFVASLWTEKGVDNQNAVFRNTLIGMLWISLCICSPRLLPPWRTARSAHSRKFLPKILMDLATLMRLTLEHHIEDDVEDEDEDSGEKGDGDEESNSDGGGDDGDDGDGPAKEKSESLDDMIVTVIQDSTLLVDGGMAKVTVFEPRLGHVICRCGAPVDLVTLLTDLTNAVNDMMFSTLTLRAFSKAGFKELQVGGLKETYEESANVLEQCAEALATGKRLEAGSGGEADEEGTTATLPPFDPIRINARVQRVESLTNEWIDAIGSIDRSRSHYNKSARKLYVKFIWPWIVGGGVGLMVAIFGCLRKALDPLTWKRVFLPPYYDLAKFIWCLKFAVGFLFLVIMHVYWPEFANLEIPTRDEPVSAHFSGWYLIAYAFSTTQTVEGTFKKGTLRALGTCAGGFSAWLALTACNDSAVGLGIWMTVFSTVAAFFGLPEGFSSRFGLDKDMAWGMAYFSMTQALIVLEVYWGYGGKNDITANRILANLAGIAMAMVMGVIPPSIYGTSPEESKFLLEDNKRVFRDCIEFMTNSSDIESLHHLHAMAKKIFVAGYMECTTNYDDTKQLESLCIFKPNAKLKFGLANMAVLGSSILSLIRFGVILKEIESKEGVLFAEGSEEQRVLATILEGLDIEEDKYKVSSYSLHLLAEMGKHRERPNIICGSFNEQRRVVPPQVTFVHLCIFISHYIRYREINLDEITWGFLGERHTSKGRRSGFAEQPLGLMYEKGPKPLIVNKKDE